MKLSKIWMIISLAVIIVLSVITNSNWVQITAAVCGVIYVFGTVLENKYGQLFGIVNSALYGYIMFSNGVYGTAIYDVAYCVPMQIYTFFTWSKDKSGKERTSISKYTARHRIIIFVALALAIGVYSIVANRLSVQFALVDGISIIFGVVGLYMISKKKVEQWYLFIISNIAMLALWSIKCVENITNMPMLVMWVVYLVNNCYGLFTWSKKLKTQEFENNNNNLKENTSV